MSVSSYFSDRWTCQSLPEVCKSDVTGKDGESVETFLPVGQHFSAALEELLGQDAHLSRGKQNLEI